MNQVFAWVDELRERVRRVARTIAAKSPLAIRGSKEMLNYARDHSVADGLNYVATWNAAMLLSADFEEAMAAQGERRPPKFLDGGGRRHSAFARGPRLGARAAGRPGRGALAFSYVIVEILYTVWLPTAVAVLRVE
ncbi:MAG: hypothetical protein V5B39_19535 [Accumulibacter sp.]|uniref:hypothetical protein n=1 Tax=Accumulibacter sp. TaxID=2053492 RepID=UPI002FC284C7